MLKRACWISPMSPMSANAYRRAMATMADWRGTKPPPMRIGGMGDILAKIIGGFFSPRFPHVTALPGGSFSPRGRCHCRVLRVGQSISADGHRRAMAAEGWS